MCTTINVLEQKKKYIVIFHPKINIFTAVKYFCILHGRVCVMLLSTLISMLVMSCFS